MRVITPGEARGVVLDHFAKHPTKTVLIGQVSMLLGNNYGLNETEALLETLRGEGVLRLATREELKKAGVTYGYVLVEATKPPAA